MQATIVKIDPLHHHLDTRSPESIHQETGIIVHWCTTREPNHTLKETLDLNYQFGMDPMTGGTILSNGIHKYPSDPDLYPLVSITYEEETVYVYEYGIVGIVTETEEGRETFVTRMD